MKKYLFLALAAIGITACTSEEDVKVAQDTPTIKFSAVAQKSSRAAITGTALPENKPIYVAAYHESTSGFAKYFEDVKFEPQGSGSGVTYNSAFPYTYMKDGKLHFSAYYCEDKAPTASWSAVSGGSAIEKLILTFTDLDAKTDVCVSRVTKTADLSTTSPGTTSLSFHHALSWICVNFAGAGDNAQKNDNLLIRKVRVGGIHKNGTLTATLYDGTASDYYDTRLGSANFTWVASDEATEQVFPAYANTAEGMSYGDASNADYAGLLVIPGNATSISFDYCMKTSDTTTSDWITHTINLSGNTWEPGTRYTYNISISSQQISFTCSVDGWVNNDTDSSIGD
ncbi:MAG: fimbrillin family protein [Bacteroidales bacterium]|nr:fimbrillin family protein [Bacteroidales bacterium]